MADAVFSKVVDVVAGLLFATVKKHINYMRKYKDNVDNLRSEFDMLKNLKEDVENKKEEAIHDGNDLKAGLENWVEEAIAHITTTENFLQEAEEFLKKEADAKKTCFNLNILHRYHYGKEATNKVPSLEKHRTKGADFKGEISIRRVPLGNLELYPRENIDDLDTHKSVLDKITRSVLDENIQITGIYGIGGVGKTTLATQVYARVKDKFALVVLVTVSQMVDFTKIKKEVEVAAKRIDKGEKVLIILDDVWTELKLHTLGIPCGADFPSCKILLTSREKSVCTKMNACNPIYVECLPMKEAWVLFKRVVGERVETDAKLEKVARKVVDGCGGLPLILQAVGKALKDKENFTEWEQALDKIAKDETSDTGRALRVEFARLKLSYDYLESEQVKSIFLLCSMFPEDYNIPLECLAYYCVGLQIFAHVDSLEIARNKVAGAVKILISSCLLLNGSHESTTKMHDIVRDVALLIASKDNSNNFLVEAGKDLTEWKPRNGSLESYTGISLMFNRICKLPHYELKIPLKIFLIQENHSLSEISDEFTQSMKKAEVIDLEKNNISSLPKSLNQLTGLRMLNLGGNKLLCDVSILGELEQLEILILSETGITEIPQEIGKLVKLRLFHAVRCTGLSHIAPGVLSNLRWLEELQIGYHPQDEGNDASLLEIGELSNLTFLFLHVPHIDLISKCDYLKRLERFKIQIGTNHLSNDITLSRALMIEKYQIFNESQLMLVRKLIEVCNGAQILIKNLDYATTAMMCCGLKIVAVGLSSNLLCLVDKRVLDEMESSETHEVVKKNKMFLSEAEVLCLCYLDSLKVIWNCPDQYISLENLVACDIGYCRKLEKLFTVGVAQGLVNLKYLRISCCHSLKEVISDEDEETSRGEIDMVVPAKNIVFPHLAVIDLENLVSLTSFYPGNATIKYPLLETVLIGNCPNMEKWGYGIHDTPKLQWVNETKANGSTILDALAKDNEAKMLRKKQWEEGLSSDCSSEGNE